MPRSIRYALALAAVLAAAPSSSPTRTAGALACADSYDVTALADGPGNTLLMGTGDGHVYRSADGGRCWSALARLPAPVEIGALLAPPSALGVLIADGSLLVSTTFSSRRIFRSGDAGKTWQDGSAGLPHTPILTTGIAVTPRGTLVLSYACPVDEQYATRTPHCPQRLARSVDSGQSWQPVGPKAAELDRGVVTLSDGSLLAAQARRGGTPITRTYRSRDDGRTWQTVGVLPGANRGGSAYNLCLIFAVPWDARQVLAGYGIEDLLPTVFRSTNRGATFPGRWLPQAHLLQRRADLAAVAFAGLPRTHTLLLTDVGYIYRSRDDGRTWRRASTGLPLNTHIWALVAAPDGGTAFAGTL